MTVCWESWTGEGYNVYPPHRCVIDAKHDGDHRCHCGATKPREGS